MPATATHQKNIKTILKELENEGLNGISVDCVIFGFDEDELKVLLIKSDLKNFDDKWSLLGDLIDSKETLDGAAYRVLKERAGMDDVYLEQVKSFGEISRHPAARVITVGWWSSTTAITEFVVPRSIPTIFGINGDS